MYSIHITPAAGVLPGQVFLKTLRVDGDSFSFTLPSACFTLRPSPNPGSFLPVTDGLTGDEWYSPGPARRDRHADNNGHLAG